MTEEIIGAFIELPPGEEPPFHSFSRWEEGEFVSRSPEGLTVKWEEYHEPPEVGVQVYLAWQPVVYAVWEEEDEGSNGTEAGITGEDADAESDESA